MKNEQIKIKKRGGRSAKPTALCFAFCAFFLLSNLVSAQIQITEIMYDLEGSDSGREWIEIYNSGAEAVDLNGWRLYEAETNHKITAVVEGGTLILPVGTYAIVADKSEIFRIDWPNFSGLIFDSAFSLINKEEGETLILKNSDLKVISQVSYFPAEEANNNDNSFQKISDGAWGACAPSPGALTAPSCQPQTGIVIENNTETTAPDIVSTNSDNPSPATQPKTSFPTEPQIFARIIPPQDTPIAGADFFFDAEAVGLENEPLQNAEYQWTFGDGAKATGKKVLHNYQYPSDYLIVLEVISGEYATADRLKIKAIPSEIVISAMGFDFNNNFIELRNPSTYELNLSWWRLRVDNDYWTFPKNTILLPRASVKFSSNTTKLFPRLNSQIQLLYPNGMLAFDYQTTRASLLRATTQTILSAPKIIVAPAPTVEPTGAPALIEPIVLQIATSAQVLTQTQTALISGALVEKETGGKTPNEPRFFNKWMILLTGIIVVAVGALIFATRLDLQEDGEKIIEV